MKKISVRVVGLLTIFLMIVTCTKDGTTPGMKNSITYNNTEYNIDGGLLEYWGKIQGTGYRYTFTLISSGITQVITNGQIDSITGTGSGINLVLFSSNSTALEVGDYTFDVTMSGSPGTFDSGKAFFNFNTVTGEGTTLDIASGKVTIISNGPVYELSFKCTGTDGKSITGYYKGSLQYYGMGNYILYNNIKYNIDGGLLEYWGKILGTGYNIDLTLFSSGLTPVITNGQIDSITGTGSGINFEIFTSDSLSYDVREYTFDAAQSGSPGTFDYANAIFNFNTATGEGTSLDITGGKVTIISKDPVYELLFMCTGADGKSVTGYYKGSLQYYNMSAPTKSALLKKRHKW